MANYRDRAFAVELDTPLGRVDAEAQGDRCIYIRAGQTDDPELSEATRAPLTGRGTFTFRARAHFKLNAAGDWICLDPFLYRVDRPDLDVNAAARRRFRDTMREELGHAAVHNDALRKALRESQEARTATEAEARKLLAVQFRLLADQLDVEAAALRAGGRVENLRGSMNGMDVRTTQVCTVDGELLPPIKTPPTVYGATDWPDRIADQRPEDRW